MLILSLFTGIVAGALGALITLLAGYGLAWAAAAYVSGGMVAMMAAAVMSVISASFPSQNKRQQTAR